MKNIYLEKFLYKDLQSKGYHFYCIDSFNMTSSYSPQIFAIHNSIVTPKILKHNCLKLINISTYHIHKFLHQRPLIMVKSFKSLQPVSDNISLCSILKQGITYLPTKDVAHSLEHYLTNIQPLFLIEHIFSHSQEKFHYLKVFSKKLTLQSMHLKNLDTFFLKHCTQEEKEDFIFSFVSHRKKELEDIHIEKKITQYLLDNFSNNTSYLEKFLPFSQFLTHQIHQTELFDIFDSYAHSIVIDIDLLKISKILGFTMHKIDVIADKFFKAVQQQHNGQLKNISDTNHSTFVLQHNDSTLTQMSLKKYFQQFLYHIHKNIDQKIDVPYCEKWYLHEKISNKLPVACIQSPLHKI